MGRIGRLWAACRWRFACRRQDGFFRRDEAERPSYRRLSREELDGLASPLLGRDEADGLGGGAPRSRLETGPPPGGPSGRDVSNKREAARRAALSRVQERRNEKMKKKIIWTVLGFLAGAAAVAWWFCKELSEAFSGLF